MRHAFPEPKGIWRVLQPHVKSDSCTLSHITKIQKEKPLRFQEELVVSLLDGNKSRIASCLREILTTLPIGQRNTNTKELAELLLPSDDKTIPAECRSRLFKAMGSLDEYLSDCITKGEPEPSKFGGTMRRRLWHSPIGEAPKPKESQLDRIEQSLGRIEELLTRG